MIDLLLTATEPNQARQWEVRGVITRSATGDTCNYDISLSSIEAPAYATGKLCNYPRWSEPVGIFVARCIAETRPRRACPTWPLFERLKLSIGVNRRVVGQHECSAHDEALVRDSPVETDDPWHRVCRAYVPAWDITSSMPWPQPLALPRFSTACGYVYVRLRDVPVEARQAFERLEYHQTRLLVQGVPDAISATEMDRFLRNG